MRTSTSRFGEAAKRRLDRDIHAFRSLAAADVDAASVAAYDRLLEVVRRRTTLLARRNANNRHAPDVHHALEALALHHADWLAPVEDWTAPAGGPWPQLAALAAHLLARYPMPRFLTGVWLKGARGQRTTWQHWYKLLGTGHSVRSLGLPLPVTRALAHRFLQSPDHLSPHHALRRAQILTLGGDEPLVQAVMATRLGRHLDDSQEQFWETVLCFFVRHPELPLAQVGPIVDFLFHARMHSQLTAAPDGTWVMVPPPQPQLSLKGRTPASLLRLVEDWHRALAASGGPYFAWAPTRLRPLHLVEKVAVPAHPGHLEEQVWTIDELCTSSALFVEGRAMQHCVRTYAELCRTGRASIWSMQLATADGRRRVATIEVDPRNRTICQVRRKRNALPGAAEMAILREWVAREGLSGLDSAARA